ncbi:hypothetical protein V2G26_002540 [Clonostachys chloroleuca]
MFPPSTSPMISICRKKLMARPDVEDPPAQSLSRGSFASWVAFAKPARERAYGACWNRSSLLEANVKGDYIAYTLIQCASAVCGDLCVSPTPLCLDPGETNKKGRSGGRKEKGTGTDGMRYNKVGLSSAYR